MLAVADPHAARQQAALPKAAQAAISENEAKSQVMAFGTQLNAQIQGRGSGRPA
jgi:hypothetical protein